MQKCAYALKARLKNLSGTRFRRLRIVGLKPGFPYQLAAALRRGFKLFHLHLGPIGMNEACVCLWIVNDSILQHHVFIG